MRRTAKFLALILALTGARNLAAQPASEQPLPPPPPPPPSDKVAGTEFKPGFVFAIGRIPIKAPDPERVAFEGNGELQLRATFLTDLPLSPFPGVPNTGRLGQEFRAEYWLRSTSHLTFGEKLALIWQFDVRGFVAGQETRLVYSAEQPYSHRDGFFIDPRWLYLEYQSPTILASAGLQGLHWGMGILDNDGDHPTLFGDYAFGARHAVLLFVVRPGGEASPFNVGAAGGISIQNFFYGPASDDLREGRAAPEAILAAFYADGSHNVLGFYGVYRRWSLEPENRAGIVYEETLDEFVVDSTGRFNAKIPGGAGFVFGEYEVAYRVGSSKFVRTPEQSPTEERADLDAIGAATRLGAVATAGSGDERWGRVVAQMEWGWASGDANPNDDTLRRFSFDPNYNVGLVLFDQVLAFKTARAGDIARYSGVVQRPNPENDRLASNGAIFGTTYVYPSLVVRPVPQLDLKAALLVAQATADFVDPVAEDLAGRFQNYDGGSTASRDLGLELDGGVEYRLPLGSRGTLELGTQAGVFFPGNAFANAAGVRMPTQYLVMLRLGLQY